MQSKILIPLLPKIKALVQSPLRYKVAEGGRGSGKSYGYASVFAVYGIIYPETRFLCTRETQNSLSDSTLAIMKRVIQDYGLDDLFKQTKHGLETVTGSEYIFRGLQNPDRIKSLDNIRFCWVAEAQRITDNAWDMLLPTVRADDSEFWIEFNPDHPDDPVSRRFIETKRPDCISTHMTFRDNPKFPEVLKKEMEWDFKTDPEKADWIWNGAYRTISEALVFKGKFRVENFQTDKDAQFFFGADWGFSGDPSALIRCYISGTELFIDYEAWGLGIELDDLPEFFDRVPESRKWRILADSARPDTISHVKKKGFKIFGAPKGKGSVEDGIEFIRSFSSVVIHTRCVHAQDEFKTYSYIRNRLTGEPTPVLEDKNNHIMDSLRYALVEARRAKSVVSLTSHI